MENNTCFFIAFALLVLNNTTISLGRTIFNSTTDHDALLAFRNTVTSDPYGILANNWSTNNTSFCYWIGVSCGIRHQRVTALNFSGFDLGGTIAPHLGNLTFVRSLDISFNNFTGFIPDELSKLRRLEVINMGVNSFTGTIPPWFGTLPELQHINVKNNTFSGSIPPSLFNSSKLLTLEMGFNFLDGEVPRMYSNSSSIETINLEYNHFTSGSVLYSIFNISSLTAINLRGNRLSGMLPSDMCNNMPKLRILYLSVNQLYGEIPPNIYKCRDLEDLRLPNNQFSGNIPSEIGSLVNLKILSLGDNNLGGGIPKQLGNLTMLKSLYLSRNELRGELPQELGNIDLVNIGVSGNALSGSIPFSMFNISTLTIMDLSSNSFNGSLPSAIGMGPSLNLEDLYLDNNRLEGPFPSYITNASTLVLMDIGKNSFSGPIPNFGNLRFLQGLLIPGNKFTGGASSSHELTFFSWLTNCQQLKYLEVSANPLNGTIPASIGNLSTSLQSFRASDCNLKGVIPPEIGNLSGLLSIVLERNELTGFIPTTLGKLGRLQGVYLDTNLLQGYIPPDICQMSNLVDLYLYGNMLTGPIPECFGELTTLRRVYLGSNNLNSSIPSSFWNLGDLVALGLSSNYLSGHLSPNIGNLKAVLEVNLSYNQFSGDIPSSIDQCQSLEYLSLANNEFGGSIPVSLGNIRSFTILNLSSNNLSGFIPQSLEDLRFLEYFDVSYNKLEGEIPSEGPFVNFTAQSFVHNSALCGLTRFQVPPCVETHKRSRLKQVALLKYILPPIVSAIVLVIVILIFINRRKQNKIPPATDSSLGKAWRRISYQELMQGTNAFSEENLLGRGGFGSVFKGSLSDGLNIAVKVFNLQIEGASKSFDIESEILSTVRHRNLVRIIGCCTNSEFKALILAYMPNGSLEKWLYSHEYCLDLLQRLDIAIDVAVALEYLHHGNTFPIVHCDLKPSNVLLDEDMTARVADFGISKLFGEGETVVQTKTLATIGYTAPEYGSEGKVSTKGDVYSYGILLLEIFTRKKPTDDMFSEETSLKDWVSEALQENAVTEIVAPGLLAREDQWFSANEKCISSIFGLAMECLAVSPEDRINMIETVAALQKIKTKLLARNGKRQ
ncbi:hypothetical protein BUALT_Bualt08G0132600 [Buddleja alternifolia]|uniref:non-specific serine/threonine protein kinase n=1 Tax=Buddleja alternifolia TaxID=168488 RepID=A0AAV6XD31_9LAMI|nr:hypothetical protein BUALT_Bualt08G0132600 [Buddleja alternifolia]